MDDQTAKVLEQLAAKLGTTSEYLWSILIRQAYIDAVTVLIYLILTIAAGIALFKMNKYLSNSNNKVSYYHEEWPIAPMILSTFVWVFVLLYMILGGLPAMINGFLNPEYWALEKVLNALK